MASTSLIDSPATPELPLFDRLPREMAPASLEGFARILPTLTERQRAVYFSLCDLTEQGHDDATGGELAAFIVITERNLETGRVTRSWESECPR